MNFEGGNSPKLRDMAKEASDGSNFETIQMVSSNIESLKKNLKRLRMRREDFRHEGSQLEKSSLSGEDLVSSLDEEIARAEAQIQEQEELMQTLLGKN